MEELIKNFSDQLKDAIEINKGVIFNNKKENIKNVILVGMGGSGIGNTIVSSIAAKQSSVPIAVVKNYFLPPYADKDTLVILTSYSGNTEEVIKAANEAIEKNTKIVCITSGGKLIEKAKEANADFIKVPPSIPPRAALGYSFISLLFTFSHFGIIKESFIEDLLSSIYLIEKEEEAIKEEAKKVSENLSGKLPVIYTSHSMRGPGIRFKQQLNENSKVLAWHQTIPEMNHNELLGWFEEHKELGVVVLRNKEDYERINKRIDISKEIISQYTGNIIDIYTKGKSLIEKNLYLIHMVDWISLFLANKREVDPTDFKLIEDFKGRLEKIEE